MSDERVQILVTVIHPEQGVLGWCVATVPDQNISSADVSRRITDWLRTYDDAPAPEPKPWWRFW